jgi:hypothetical protein
MENQFLAGEGVSSKTDVGYDIFIYVRPNDGKIETILAFGPFGDSEYDPETRRWASLGEGDTWRVRELHKTSKRYKIDWDNDEDFDRDMHIITLQKFADGTLTEDYLKNNAILVNNAPK